MYVRMYVCIYIYLNGSPLEHTRALSLSVCMYVCMYVRMYVYLNGSPLEHTRALPRILLHIIQEHSTLSVPGLLCLLRQYLYICTSKASKLSTQPPPLPSLVSDSHFKHLVKRVHLY
jgi:hypothetical protein